MEAKGRPCSAIQPQPGAQRRVQDAVDDPNDQRASLERTVRNRDSTVSGMEKKRQEKEAELAALQKELEHERLKQMEEAILVRAREIRVDGGPRCRGFDRACVLAATIHACHVAPSIPPVRRRGSARRHRARRAR